MYLRHKVKQNRTFFKDTKQDQHKINPKKATRMKALYNKIQHVNNIKLIFWNLAN